MENHYFFFLYPRSLYLNVHKETRKDPLYKGGEMTQDLNRSLLILKSYHGNEVCDWIKHA